MGEKGHGCATYVGKGLGDGCDGCGGGDGYGWLVILCCNFSFAVF